MSKKLVIAIDGPAGAGKSTVGRQLARMLGYAYIDTGVMYRGVAWAALKRQVVPDTAEKVQQLFQTLDLEFYSRDYEFRFKAKGEDVTAQLRSPEVSQFSSAYSALPAVRLYLTEIQRQMGDKGGVVMDGRDIGTVVFPQADCKFFLDADAGERGRRRQAELVQSGNGIDLKSTVEQINHRDRQDSRRQLAPLKRAEDAVYIDHYMRGDWERTSLYNLVIERSSCNSRQLLSLHPGRE